MNLNFHEIEATRKGANYTTKVFSSDMGVEVVRMTLAPNSTLPVHTTKMDVIFYFLSGEGRAILADKEIPVREGSVLDSPKEVPHGIINESDSPMEVLVIKLM